MSHLKQIGTVEEVSEIVCLVRGLPHASMDEEVIFESGAKGMVLRLDEDYVYVVLLGRENTVRRGSEVMGTGEPLSVPVGDELLGRVINPLGEPVDGKAIINTDLKLPIERPAPSIFERRPIKQQLETGIVMIDAMLPLGRGQRETIIGDPKSGKSNSVYTAILNQARLGILSVYVTIGKPQSKIKAFVERLKNENLLDKVVIVMGTASMSPTLNFVAPYAGTTIAEYFMEKGKDVLVVYDDLSQHAKYYRQMSLLLKRSPGREAYPGDIFFIHSRLLERAAALTEEKGGGSITSLPLIEIKERDLTGYVPTNVLSITDGHILYDIGLFNQNIIPSVALELSVSRLGGKVQCPILKKLGVTTSQDLMRYREAQAFAHFGTDLAQETKNRIERGKRIIEFLKQDPYEAISIRNQIIMLYGLTKGIFDKVKIDAVRILKKQIFDFMQTSESWKTFYDDILVKDLRDLRKEFISLFKELEEKFIKAQEIVDEEVEKAKEKAAEATATATEAAGPKSKKKSLFGFGKKGKKDNQEASNSGLKTEAEAAKPTSAAESSVQPVAPNTETAGATADAPLITDATITADTSQKTDEQPDPAPQETITEPTHENSHPA
ncbi:MAG TPA: F0F1 ATP synthase subunit alpha [bacterium]|nr:F0F1 ATP synthase subunit alpha [bacterium]